MDNKTKLLHRLLALFVVLALLCGVSAAGLYSLQIINGEAVPPAGGAAPDFDERGLGGARRDPGPLRSAAGDQRVGLLHPVRLCLLGF